MITSTVAACADFRADLATADALGVACRPTADIAASRLEDLLERVEKTALLDRLLHHAIVIPIEGSSYRLRQHADLVPENVRARPCINQQQQPPKRRGRPPGKQGNDPDNG